MIFNRVLSDENCLRKVMDTDKHIFTRKVHSFVIKKKVIYLQKPILITIIHLFLLKGSLSDTSAI